MEGMKEYANNEKERKEKKRIIRVSGKKQKRHEGKGRAKQNENKSSISALLLRFPNSYPPLVSPLRNRSTV